jgi:hypothetical protein
MSNQTVEVIFNQAKPPVPPKPNVEPEPDPANPVVVPTSEEIEKNAKDLYSTLGWGEPPVTIKDTPAGEGTAEVAPAGGAAAAAPEAPKPEPEPELEPEPEPTTEDIITRTADRVGQSIARAMKPAEPTNQPVNKPDVELSPEDSEYLDVIRFLERKQPAKYSGAAAKFLAYVKAHYAYQDAWAAANPGKEYDMNDSDHVQWYEQNSPDLDHNVLDRAKIDMRVEKEVNDRLEPELKQKRVEAAIQRDVPKIAMKVTKRIHEFMGLVDPTLQALITDDKGNPLMTDASTKKIEEADPIAFEVCEELTRNSLEPLLLELGKTMVPELEHKIDPRTNLAHRAIDVFRAEKEGQLKQMPSKDRQKNGRDWITISEYQQRENRINNSSKSDQEKNSELNDLAANYWCLDVDDLEGLIVDSTAKKAKAIIEKRNKTASKKYGKTEANTPSEQNGRPTPAAAAAAVLAAPVPSTSGRKPNAPSVAAQPASGASPDSRGPGVKTYEQEATEIMFK